MSVVMILLVLNYLFYSSAEFSVTPSNVLLPIGSAMGAVFRCSHESTEAVISWRVNGSSNIAMFHDIVVDIFHNGSATLTIPARLEYDGLEVVCVAFIDGTPPVIERTPIVTLILLAGLTVPTAMITERDMMETELIFTTESIRDMFTEHPSDVTLLFESEPKAVFRCSHQSPEVTIGWTVNGSAYSIRRFPDIITPAPFNENGVSVNTLTIPARLEYNKTEVVCRAFFNIGSLDSTTSALLLIMTGPLRGFTNLVRNTSTLTWEAPFSLDLTGVDPDIVYCVEVYNITCGMNDLVVGDCNVTEPSYTSDDAAPYGYIYEYTVTPRSNVQGARNGSSTTITEEFMILSLSSKRHTFSMIDDASKVMVTFHLDFIDTQALENHVDADLYSISLRSIDGVSAVEGEQLASDVVMKNGSFIVFQVPLLFRRLWAYTLLAHGCEEHPVMNATHLSTHDIQGISITTLRPGKIRVTGTFISGSTATGVLVAALSNSGICFYLLEREGFQVGLDGILSNVAGGQHHVSVFVMKNNGLPVHRTATVPQSVMVIKGSVNQLFIEYVLHSMSTGVCITCTFLDSSPTDCVVVVHQRISQLSSSGLMNIESSHKFYRSGDTAYGCIEGVNLGDYQVGVIGGREKQPVTTTTNARFLLTAFYVIILLLATFVVCVAIISYILRKKKKITGDQTGGDLPDNSNVELQKCGAYEVVQLSRQRVAMNDNPAYGEVGVGEYAVIM